MANINFIDRAATSTAFITTVVITFTSSAIVALGNQSFADEDPRDEYRKTIISNSLNTLLERDSQSVPEPNSVVGSIVLSLLVLLLKRKSRSASRLFK